MLSRILNWFSLERIAKWIMSLPADKIIDFFIYILNQYDKQNKYKWDDRVIAILESVRDVFIEDKK